MSRYDPDREQLDETRDLRSERTDRAPTPDAPWSPARDLLLPRTPERQPVDTRDTRLHLRHSETQILATIGTFRIVPEHELGSTSPNLAADLRSLSDQGLVESRTIVINDTPERIFVLTRTAETLLETHRDPARTDDHLRQEYYAGIVKPRELAHDAQLCRLFQSERDPLEAEGAHITRVMLDYELKRDYHAFVRQQQQEDVDASDARQAFAHEHDLPFVRGHIELPDVRIEYEDADGRQMHRDLELATEHYSRSQLAGKHTAGFHVYRAAGPRGAGGGKLGGTPADPHHLDWLR